VPFRIVPERGQIAEKLAEPGTGLLAGSNQQIWDIFHDDVLRLKLANEAVEMPPKAAAFASKSRLTPGPAEVLAGEASADGMDGNSICCEAVGGEASHVFIAGHLWPVFRQHAAAERIDLAERDGLKPGPFKAKAEPANSAEQVKQLGSGH
jgi:hypothetical protein